MTPPETHPMLERSARAIINERLGFAGRVPIEHCRDVPKPVMDEVSAYARAVLTALLTIDGPIGETR